LAALGDTARVGRGSIGFTEACNGPTLDFSKSPARIKISPWNLVLRKEHHG
jgi:hypothetical protein